MKQKPLPPHNRAKSSPNLQLQHTLNSIESTTVQQQITYYSNHGKTSKNPYFTTIKPINQTENSEHEKSNSRVHKPNKSSNKGAIPWLSEAMTIRPEMDHPGRTFLQLPGSNSMLIGKLKRYRDRDRDTERERTNSEEISCLGFIINQNNARFLTLY